jgi:hypothetical protein
MRKMNIKQKKSRKSGSQSKTGRKIKQFQHLVKRVRKISKAEQPQLLPKKLNFWCIISKLFLKKARSSGRCVPFRT